MNRCRWRTSRDDCISIAAGLGAADDERCGACPHYAGKARGAGDIVHSVTRATGLDRVAKAVLGDDCGCAKRRAALNAAIPFPDRRGGEP